MQNFNEIVHRKSEKNVEIHKKTEERKNISSQHLYTFQSKYISANSNKCRKIQVNPLKLSKMLKKKARCIRDFLK